MGERAVRRAGPADLDRIDRIEAASFDRDRFPRRNLKRMLDNGRTIFLLAGGGPGEGGYIAVSLRAGSGVARIYSLAVDPASRRQGLAMRLIEAARVTAHAAGCRLLRLEVRQSNSAALHLYRAVGFHLRGERKAYYEDGETALLLEADLPAPGPIASLETQHT